MGRKDDKGGARKKRRGDIAVFKDSGLTDDDRRVLRRQQRDLHHRVSNDIGRGEDEDVMEFLGRGRDDNNELFEKVCYTREAVLDADNTALLAQRSLQHVDGLVQVPRFDATKLASKIRSKCSNQFSWARIGHECGVCFNSVPSGVTFLAGTMDQVEVVAKKKARKARKPRFNVEELEEQRPEQLNQESNKGDADKLSAAEHAMKDMKRIIKKKSRVNQGEEAAELDGVQFLFNPKSFTQTVENIFHYSFLIKRKEGKIGVRTKEEAEKTGQKPGLWVQATDEEEADETADDSEQTQAVVAFNMRDWRMICQAHELKECMLKHRTGSKQVRARASQQQQD